MKLFKTWYLAGGENETLQNLVFGRGTNHDTAPRHELAGQTPNPNLKT
jgi:hypothetical protein